MINEATAREPILKFVNLCRNGGTQRVSGVQCASAGGDTGGPCAHAVLLWSVEARRRGQARARCLVCLFSVPPDRRLCGRAQGAPEAPLAASALGSGSMGASTVGSLAGSTMTGSQLHAGSALRTLIGQKEKELHDMNEYRIQVRGKTPRGARCQWSRGVAGAQVPCACGRCRVRGIAAPAALAPPAHTGSSIVKGALLWAGA